MRTQINIKLDEKTLRKLDKRAEEEGRSRTNLIENILKHHLGKNYWIWVNSGQMDIGDDLQKGEELYWNGCHEDTEKGDKVLIYRTSPHKHIKYIGEVTEDAEMKDIPTDKGTKEGYSCNFIILDSFDNPLEISEMRNYESLRDWYPLKVSFIKMVFEIPGKYWSSLRDIIITKNPETKNSFE